MRQVLRKIVSEGRLGVLALGSVLAVAGCGGGGGSGGGTHFGGGGTIAPINSSPTNGPPGSSSNLTAMNVFPNGDIAIYGSATQTTPPAQQIIVEGYFADGSTRDLTRTVTYKIGDSTMAQISGDGLVTPLKAGTTTLTVTTIGQGGQTLSVTRNIVNDPSKVAGKAGVAASSVELYPGPVTRLTDVNPTKGSDQFQQFIVLVHFADGTAMDITRNFGLQIEDNNGNPSVAARFATNGLLRATDNATLHVVAFMSAYSIISDVTVISGKGNGSPNGFSPYSGAPLMGSTNAFDVTALTALKSQLISPANLSSDNEFIRRVTADVIGRLPTPAETSAFVSSTDPAKRAKLIDALLAMPAFGMHWATDVVGAWTTVNDKNTVAAFNTELAAELNSDTPLSTVMTNMATATGPLGAAFDATFPMAYQRSDALMLTWTGMTSKCGRCHNHHLTTPQDDPMWLQDDNYSLYAFFAMSATDATEIDINAKPVLDKAGKPVVMQPGWVVDGYANKVTTGLPLLTDPIATRRAKFASLMSASSAFARGTGHRIWSEVMDRLLDPNQFLQANIASVVNPKLLATITSEFQAQQSSLKGFLRDILNSKLYQLTTAGKDTKNDALFARRTVRRHHSEVLDSGIAQLTGTPAPNELMVSQSANNLFPFNFGFPGTRGSITERNDAVNMSQAFTLMNSPLSTNGELGMTGNQVTALATSVTNKTVTLQQAITTLFQSALQRDPSSTELAAFMTESQNATTGGETTLMFLQDVAVALGASIEYVMR
jgi:hypothetical protein